jgi:DNA-binding CsgD family transcriptional regulator
VWTQLWRGVVAYRIAALLYAGVLLVKLRGDFARPDAALAVLAGMAAWTVLVTLANSRDAGRVRPVVIADHVVCAALTVASLPIQGSGEVGTGAPTLTTAGAAVPVPSPALLGGPWGGVAGAIVPGAASVAVRGEVTQATLGNVVAKGMSARQVADRLVLSHRTVQNHVQNSLRKLQVHNRVELTRYAIEQGLDAD